MTGMWVCMLTENKSDVWKSDFGPAGQYLVTGGWNHPIVLWRYREVDE
jgi:hypothetical protein